MLDLTAQSIKDYQVCSLYYDFRYNQELPTPSTGDQLLAEKFNNTIHRILSYYFFKRQGSLSVSLNSLMGRWERLWFPKNMDAYDLAVDQHSKNNLASYATQASGQLIRFYDEFQGDNGYPLLIDEKFCVPATRTIKLSGSFDLVLRYKDGSHKIIKWYTGRQHPHLAQYMFEFAILRRAWLHRNDGRPAPADYFIYDLHTNGFISYSISRNDINALEYWIRAIESNEVFIPRRPFTVYCRGCPFDSQCKEYSFPDPNEYEFT